MDILTYLKDKGIRRTLQVIYEYKLDLLLQKLILPFVKRKPLKDTIVIESHDDFDSNGGAFYDYLIRNGYHKRYKLVWLLKHPRPQGIPENVETFFLHKPGFRKNYHICTAKYFTADNELVEKVRPGQIALFCDHGGVSLKSVQGLYCLPDSIDYILSPSEHYAPVLAKQYDISWPDKRFIHVGYPQHDVFWQESDNELAKLTEKTYRKVFLWMPTFRKGIGFRRNDSEVELPFGIPLVETREDLQRIQEFLEKTNSLLIIKIHPKQDLSTVAELQGSENIRILTGKDMKTLGINNYRLLKNVDGLISDYSSIAFSFMLLDRPVGFVLSDMDSYSRGFSVEDPESYLAGHRIYHFEEFFAFLEDVCQEDDPHGPARRALTDRLFIHRDGQTCRRITEILGLEK